jgi:polyhydroxyalkanoate synthesis repressor PhaR
MAFMLQCSNFIVAPASAGVKGQFLMKPDKVIIRKYENRRLYDATNSRYVNLDEVAAMLRDGIEIQALDAASGEDITRLVLTQIIVEGAKDQDSALPLDILRQMVVATGKAGQEGFARYMRAMLDMYQNAYRALPRDLPPFDFLRMMMPGGPPATAAGPARAHEDESEVRELRRRIEGLERRAGRRSRPGSKKTRPRKKGG